MKRALVFQHMDHDHPGRFLDYFTQDDIVPRPVRLFAGEDIPPLQGFDMLFVLGGEQDAWQEEKFPWLKAEKQAIREWVLERAKPYFGVCLGHQLLACALGGEVAPAAEGEVGIFNVTFNSAARGHRLFKGLPVDASFIQWHHAEVKRAPEQAVVLASSKATAVQVMAVGDHAIGTQFHCEFSAQTLAGWTSMPDYLQILDRHLGPGGFARLQEQAYPLMPVMAENTRMIYDNFVAATGLSSRV